MVVPLLVTFCMIQFMYSSVLSYLLFRGTMNCLQYVGRVYWITRDNGVLGTKHVAFDAFMRGTSPPWKVGRGVQFRWGKHTVQVGICHDGPPAETEMDGLLNMLGGRYLDAEEEKAH